MTNQAAQTMPAMTPERCSFFLRRFKNDEKMLGPNEQLALDYAIAALAQTAGADVMTHFCNAIDNLNDMPVSEEWAKKWTAKAEFLIGIGPDPGDQSLSDTPNQTHAASVSERARELRERAEAHGGGVFVSIGDIRAIEQAMTQQRGDDVESAACALFEAQADPLAASWDRQWEPTKAYWRLVARGYHVNADGVLTQPAYVSVHCGLADFTDYFVKNYPGPDTIIHDPKWHAPRIFGAARRAIMASPEYAAATTPQPSADAVRELVKRWRELSVKSHRDGQYQGYDTLRLCADELESLLSAASDHQQNAAQGGGEK